MLIEGDAPSSIKSRLVLHFSLNCKDMYFSNERNNFSKLSRVRFNWRYSQKYPRLYYFIPLYVLYRRPVKKFFTSPNSVGTMSLIMDSAFVSVCYSSELEPRLVWHYNSSNQYYTSNTTVSCVNLTNYIHYVGIYI